MRATCEACGRLQPPGWKAGDLCAHCGAAVRREVRCFWCVAWTPAAKFCRSCGAEVVDERAFGAARMIKDAGTDRFTVPKMLRELDPEQVENFTRIYQRQSALVARHVDDLLWVQRFLHHQGFAGALEDALIPQLPWPQEVIAQFTAPLPHAAPPPRRRGEPAEGPVAEDVQRLRDLAAGSPCAQTRDAATIARLRREDWQAYDAVEALVLRGDADLGDEAALALTAWRTLTMYPHPRARDALVAQLARSPFRLAAAAQAALLGTVDDDALRDALGSADRDIAFTAALALGDVDRLIPALRGDELPCVAAGRRLAGLGVLEPLAGPMAYGSASTASLEARQALIEAVFQTRKPAPALEPVLLRILGHDADDFMRKRAASILALRPSPATALAVALACRDQSILMLLLREESGLDSAATEEVVAVMVREGPFHSGTYGVEEAAKRGAITDAFVPRLFAQHDEERQRALLRLAEVQLGARGDEALHRFVLGVALGPHRATVRAAARWSLWRWYRDSGQSRPEPFSLQAAPIARFFGSPAALVPLLAAVLRDDATLKEVGYYEFVRNLLGEADAAHLVAATPAPVLAELAAALIGVVQGDYWPSTRSAATGLIGRLGAAAPDASWVAGARAAIEALHAASGRSDYYYQRALQDLGAPADR